VYRVVQEALANAAQHARATRVRVTVTRAPEQLLVTIVDDGAGFDPARPPEHGIGLITMRERAMLLRGELTVESAAGQGTTVRLTVPLGAELSSAPEGAGAAPSGPHPIEALEGARAASGPPHAAVVRPLPAPLDLEVFRKMADMSSEAFRLADRDGRFVYVNDRSGELSGYSRDEMYAMTVSDIAPDFPTDVWRRWATAVQGPIRTFETRNRRKDGALIPVEASITRIESRGEIYFFAVIRDITDRKEVEASQKGFTRRLLHMLEAERHRVARELHDEVGQAVATVGVLLHAFENAAGSMPEDLHSGPAATQNTIRQITESVARIVRDYHPAELLGLGLEDSLRTHARHFAQRHGLVLRLATTSVDGLLSDEHALHVYRIVQEALANVARHAGARRVTVRLARQGSRVVATVRDDGIGFDPESVRPGGLGLVTMRERAALIGGALVVRSTPGRGTEVRLSVAAETPRGSA
jgi:PAS domain S-box-containing protein